MQPTSDVGYLLQHLAFTMSRQSDQTLQERLGIGFSQFKILMVLDKSPYIQQRQIADALGQTEASISRQIKLMMERGLLQSSPRAGNRREHVITPTTKGLRLLEESMVTLNSYHGPMFDRLNQKQRQQLIEALSTMHVYVCRAGKPGACDHPFSA